MDPHPRHSSEAVVGTPISVGALLRREGRGRHAFDRPLVPRGHSRPAPEPVAPSRHGVRKVAAAAGALFAVGAVIGGVVLEEALLGPDVDDAAPDVDGAGPDLARPGNGRADVPSPGPGQILLTTAVSQLFSDGSLPRVAGADIGRDALAAAANTPDGETGPGPIVGGIDPALAPADIPSGPVPVGDATGPGAGDPGPVRPATGAPDPDDPAPAGTDPSGPGPSGPGPNDPGPNDPGDPDTGRGIPLPDLGTPPVEVPAATVPGTPLSTPAIALSEAAVVTPDLGLDVGDDGLVLDPSRTAVSTPDLAVDEVDAGPLGLSGTAAELPDLAVGGDEGQPLLAVGAQPELTVPEVGISSATPATPDLRLGDTTVEVPDLATPELSAPALPLVETVGGLLGR